MPLRSSRASSRALGALAVGLLLALGLVTVTTNSPAQAAPTRATVKAAAEKYAFTMSLPDFLRTKAKKPYDAVLDWGDDKCSAPFMKSGLDAMFGDACKRHDFGYRNFGKGPTFGDNAATKKRIDDKLLWDMNWICTTRFAGSDSCRAIAAGVYTVLRTQGKSETAFYAGACSSGRFCLFDDAGYEDRRISLSSSENNMNDINFGDKTTSVQNKTSVSWVVYDDDNYRDRAFCIKPGVSVRDFGSSAYKFSDKTSSAKKLSSAACPSGIAVIK